MPNPILPDIFPALVGVAPADRSLWDRLLYPPLNSTGGGHIDNVADFVHIVTVIFFVLIIGIMVVFAVIYRRRGAAEHAPHTSHHNTALELGWTLPPVLVVMAMFYLGARGFIEAQTPPAGAYEIEVTGQKWSWQFTYPNGFIPLDGALHVPAETPVVLRIQAKDVLHSVFIPAFRVKIDAVPGRYTMLWFEALRPTPHVEDPAPQDQLVSQAALDMGHILYCTEFCGTSHSQMLAKVVVHPRGWRPPEPRLPEEPVALGKMLFQLRGCAGCHQVNKGGAKLAGPTFADGIFGKQEQVLVGGATQTITVDEAYVRESIVQPMAKLVVGYPPAMPQGMQFTDKELDALIAYFKTLQ